MKNATSTAIATNGQVLATHPLATLTAHFDLGMTGQQIPFFRRMVNEIIGAENDLFHNHDERGRVRYRYPLVQYKTLQRKAVLLGIGAEGIAAVQAFLDHPEFRAIRQSIGADDFLLSSLETDELHLHAQPVNTYRLHHWLALNDANACRWRGERNMVARLRLLEGALASHILKFCSAIHWQLPPHSLEVKLEDCCEHRVRFKDNPFTAFDIGFCTNISLPNLVGLGKAVSHGFGTVIPPNVP